MRVEASVGAEHLKMQMVAERVTGLTHIADDLPGFDVLANVDDK